MDWINEMFGTNKPIIAMCHLRAMPGDPGYDATGGMRAVADQARRDYMALREGGVDAVMFSNEFSMPYLLKARPETTAAMGRVIGGLLHEIDIPFGVNVLWDPYASLDLAAATGAFFIREIMSGVYAGDFGLWNTDSGDIARHKARLGLNGGCAAGAGGRGGVKMLFNIVPEAARYLAPRSIEEIARTTVFNNRPDAICVSGIMAGESTDSATLKKVKDAIPETAVFANTGCNIGTIEAILSVADGAVVGTTFKTDGKFENPVDVRRARAFMDIAKSARRSG